MIDYTDRRYDLSVKDKDDKPLLTRVTHSEAAAHELRGEISLAALEAALRSSAEFTTEERGNSRPL